MTAVAPPSRPITPGPKFHWFGYYDKLQFDPAGRRVLGMATDFEHRSPRPDDVIEVGMVDLDDGDRWLPLGTSRAWCWQQGCMLQWLPGSDREIVWNDREDDQFVARIMDVESGRTRTIPHPVYCLSPDGLTAVTPDFRRVNDTRPGYGYCGLADPCVAELTPSESGIWRVDLAGGAAELIVSLARIVEFGTAQIWPADAKHWFNHLLFSPSGERFEFLHRWSMGQGFNTRMLTAALDGSDLRLVDPSGHTSHFIWRDPSHILAWSRHPSHEAAFYLFPDGEGEIEVVGREAMLHNGHCSYLPGGEWVLNDTYPLGEQRLQELYLYHVPSGRRVELGAFPAPKLYAGEWRCDLHPRFSPDAGMVVIDGAHSGDGRQMYAIDIREIVDGN